jgi:hypothetical protein
VDLRRRVHETKITHAAAKAAASAKRVTLVMRVVGRSSSSAQALKAEERETAMKPRSDEDALEEVRGPCEHVVNAGLPELLARTQEIPFGRACSSYAVHSVQVACMDAQVKSKR